MEIWQMIVGVLLFMLATMLIYAWGLRKQMSANRDLMNLLFAKGQKKVLQYLKEHPHITAGEMEKMCSDIRARQLFSKKTAVVVDPKTYTAELFAYMIKTGQLEKQGALYKKIQK